VFFDHGSHMFFEFPIIQRLTAVPDTLPRLSTPFVVHVREAGGARCSSAAASTSTRPRTRFSSPKVGWAFVVPRDPADPPTLAELRACAELASFKRPDGLTVLAELPLTTMFKVDRRALRASRERA